VVAVTPTVGVAWTTTTWTSERLHEDAPSRAGTRDLEGCRTVAMVMPAFALTPAHS
jgi:hypothetical protein